MPAINDELHIGEETLSLDLKETFKALRIGLFQTAIPSSFNVTLEGDPEFIIYAGFISRTYASAFNLDHNSTGLFTVTFENGEPNTGLGTVTVEANYPGAVFIDNNTLPAIMEITIINEEATAPIEIDSVTFSPALSLPCKQVNVVVTTSVLATKILSPFVLNGNTENPFEFLKLRGQTFTLLVENAEGNQATQIIQVPSILDVSNFDISINNSPNGATVTVTDVNIEGLNLEYSLDNDTWQISNVFSGLEANSYTLFVRDQLGCSFTKTFLVSDNNIHVPFFYIGKSNSIRFAQRITFGDASNYRNDENTLSCELNVGVSYREAQLFQTADVVTCQYKSNYDSNVIKVIKADGTEVDVPVVQKTNNIGIKDKRDARKYNLGDGKVGIYFLNGNRYNYDTNAIVGTHALNGLLPEWGLAGNYINIAGSWFIIERVVFDELKNSDVLVITETYAGADVEVVAGCIYNIYPYEVYEFSIDMVDYINESIRVKLINSDPNFPTIEHLSEQIDVAVRHENTIDINYWNNDNNDVFYATGIRHRIRQPFTKVEGIGEEESTIHKTDTNAILLNADLYEGDKFTFEPTTKEIWRKLMMALSHKNVYLDGVQYVKNGDFETDGPLDDSNLYVLKASMLKTGNVYNSDGSTFGAGNTSNAEVIGIIEGNDGFIAY